NLVWENLKKNLIELNSFEKIKKDPITALSISVSGDEALPIDKNGNVLYNTIMSMDKRGDKENECINNLIGAEQVYRITGMPPDNLYTLNRILWFKNKLPDVYENTYKFLCWEDFIFYKLGAEPSTDYSVACRTLAFDIIENKWSENIIKKVEVDISKFPDVHPSGTPVGEVSNHLLDELGFKNKIKIITGGFDQSCAALGAGVTENGMVSLGTGTMEVMQVCFNKPKFSKKMMDEGYSFNTHVLKNLYICLSLNFNGGVIFKWYRDNFGYEEKIKAREQNIEVYDLIMDSANNSNFPVLFLPYFEGAQTPWKNPFTSGTILGLTLRTKKEDIIRGIIEGITFDLRLNLEKIQESGIKIETIRVTGGGARSETWLQFKADISGKIIQKLDTDEAGCMSAAVLAGYGTGDFNSIIDTINAWVKIKKEYKPDMEKFKKYETRYLQFVDAYKKTRDMKFT
ncbi:MAG: FGGY family carbohydrate kinase, partial [Actinobacteria bacterium]|nr:FGGY family carbohydrate kinase [Actinomycetota bacterium]